MACLSGNPGQQLGGLSSDTPSAIDHSHAANKCVFGNTYVNLDRFRDKVRVGIEKPHIRLNERC